MADSREPPPLFNDDDDSRKDDDNDDLFTSAVQSPVSELTTPEDQTKQEGAGDPLTSPPPATSFPPDPSGGDRPDLFESCEEPSVGGFSSVPLEQPAEGGGTQQVSTDAQDPPPTPPTTPSVGSLVEIPLIVDTDQDLQPSTSSSSSLTRPDFTLFDTTPDTSETPVSSPDILSPPTTSNTSTSTTTSAQELSASPPSSSALLDLSMTLPQELSSEPPANLVDASSVEPAVMSSFITPAEEASVLDAAAPTNDDDDDAAAAAAIPTNLAGEDPALSSEEALVTVYDSETPEVHTSAPELDADSSLNNVPSFLGDGETTEISLDDNAQDPPLPASNILPPMGAPLTPPVAPITPTATPNLTPNVTPAAPTPVTPVAAARPSAEQLESESGDEFIEISISDPQKIGDGMSSYMAYKVTTKTNIPYFRKKHWSVTRRFSDFLGLHGKLVEKHLHSGRIIPPAPEKSAIGTTKIKLGSDKSSDSSSTDFIERRRASLERYMNRTAAHPTLRSDPDFREFIELDAELPRATQTSALSSAGVLRLFNRVGETVNKMTFKMDESDQWFEEKTQQIENLDAQLRKLHAAMEGLVAYRRELATSTASFAKSAAVLSSVEEHSALSRALHQLAESTERTHTIHHAQADADFYHLSETTKDYIHLIGAVKDVFHERVKTFQTWQHSQTMLAKKREAKAKAELAGRMDKVQQAQDEVAEWEAKVERSQEEFDRISRAIKKEMEQFDIVRVKDFKDMLVKYLEALMTSQQQIIKVWETFLPEARAIS
ncbi:sorting nexin-2-like isoform X2 [Penaeus japonicus]|uniref:sorting nexin-2-like isoform X2 n=1 Tax=Penaeus japonicus TaxID=27405 RepID=UPI001C715AF2|nr:sorting nexin-2-like isoform X2 [Penaeus japonicus]